MRVAIFGAFGTIGRAAAAELLRRGHGVRMSYLQTTPVLDDSALGSVLPLRKTPYDEGIRLTLDHLRNR